MVTFNKPSENVRGMFSFVHSCQFSPGANNKLLLSSLIKRLIDLCTYLFHCYPSRVHLSIGHFTQLIILPIILYFVFYSRMFLEYQKKYNYFIDLGCKQPILTNQLGCCVERGLACLKRHFA